MRNALGALEALCTRARQSTGAKTQWLGVMGDVLAVQSPWLYSNVLRGQFCSVRAGAAQASQMLTFDCPPTLFVGCKDHC